jgi:hypothetical protein
MENKTEIKTYLPIFKGFYGSVWEDYLTADGEAEHYNLPEEFDFFNYLDYDKYHEELVRQFCQIAENHLYQFVEKIIFEKLVSPKYYNFSNDSIDCIIIPKLEAIKNYIYSNKEEYGKYLKDNYTSRDGFISYHANDFENWEALTEDFTDLTGSHTLGSILNFIAQNEDITEEIFYYDVEDVHIGNFYTDEFYEIIKQQEIKQ